MLATIVAPSPISKSPVEECWHRDHIPGKSARGVARLLPKMPEREFVALKRRKSFEKSQIQLSQYSQQVREHLMILLRGENSGKVPPR